MWGVDSDVAAPAKRGLRALPFADPSAPLAPACLGPLLEAAPQGFDVVMVDGEGGAGVCRVVSCSVTGLGVIGWWGGEGAWGAGVRLASRWSSEMGGDGGGACITGSHRWHAGVFQGADK